MIGITVIQGPTIDNLGPGTYIVTVTAEDGCFAVDSAMVVAPPDLEFG